jgi:cell wall assembly regulator SMI1
MSWWQNIFSKHSKDGNASGMDVMQLYEQAETFFDQGNYGDAVTAYSKALTLVASSTSPDDASRKIIIATKVATTLMKMDEFENAQSVFDQFGIKYPATLDYWLSTKRTAERRSKEASQGQASEDPQRRDSRIEHLRRYKSTEKQFSPRNMTPQEIAMARTAVDDAVGKLELALKRLGKTMSSVFGPPETAEAVSAVESLLGTSLPEDYRYFLNSIGAQRLVPLNDTTATHSALIRHFDIISPATATSLYQDMVEIWDPDLSVDTVGPVKPLFKNELWWPCVDMGHRGLCLDMDPADGGRFGQIIFVADNEFDRKVVADSFAGLLCNMAAALERGNDLLEQHQGNDEFGDFDRQDWLQNGVYFDEISEMLY